MGRPGASIAIVQPNAIDFDEGALWRVLPFRRSGGCIVQYRQECQDDGDEQEHLPHPEMLCAFEEIHAGHYPLRSEWG